MNSQVHHTTLGLVGLVRASHLSASLGLPAYLDVRR
jgi:hypothetical protein